MDMWTDSSLELSFEMQSASWCAWKPLASFLLIDWLLVSRLEIYLGDCFA